MAIIYYNIHDGLVLTDKQEAGEEAVRQGRALGVNSPDNISSWRLSLNLQTKQVVVYGGIEKTEEQALQQQDDEVKARALADKRKEDLRLALIEKQAAELKALQETFNNLGAQ